MAEEKKNAGVAEPVIESGKKEVKADTKSKTVDTKQAEINNDATAVEEPKTEEKVEKKESEVETKNIDTPSNLLFYPEVRTDIPEMRPGDVVVVSYRVVEGGKERIQLFEGTVIALKNSGISKTVTVRKTSYGIAIERIFPINSKLVQKIEVKKHSRVRRAKLYYLRKLKGKAARLKELR